MRILVMSFSRSVVGSIKTLNVGHVKRLSDIISLAFSVLSEVQLSDIHTERQMPNETKRIAVRPNQGSALQRTVEKARTEGVPVSNLIHSMAETFERASKRKEKASV